MRGRAFLERPARLLVDGIGAVRAHRVVASFVGLLVIFLSGTSYLLLGTLDVNPLRGKYTVRVELAQSGGLLPGQDVTLHGVKIGTVAALDIVDNTVVAVANIDERTSIPGSGPVRVASLSAAGEQYLDFAPTTDDGPYLADGSVVPLDRTSTPTTLATMLGDLSGTLAQVDPDKIRAVERELGVSSDGPEKLAAIVDGGTFLISTLDSVLPQTVSLLHNSKVLLGLIGENGQALHDTAGDLAATMRGVNAKTGGFEQMVDLAPGALTTMDAIIAQNSPTMVQLLGNLTTTSQMLYLHIPALQEFFWPQQRGGSTLDAITSTFHDGGIWALASIYPKYSCDYNLPRQPGIIPDFPEPYLNAHCANPDPSVLIRGAANAPRPPGDNTATPPPGADPLATADPTPTGPYTIPTPYGGVHATLETPKFN
ncbi:MlaD family protein [Nocardia bovistercoris]|uniref:MCE family protein n=1 Tax=Nocardia bovistercoris TaxID=2785916 RepID=A0A931I7Z1_9NOCA|nr:MlaD family protein [Nocardia bovistercoris]MBH0776607.1 MCE family protein [Nocardia bovistercoris]